MKRAMFSVVLLLVFIVSFGATMSVLAAGPDDNFQKAGQLALTEREMVLSGKLMDIETYVQIAAADRVVTKDEMVVLRNKINDFTRTKERLERELSVYGLKIATALDNNYSEAVRVYFASNGINKEDVHDAVRKFFASVVGVDVAVDSGMFIDISAFLAIFMAVIFLALAVLFTVSLVTEINRTYDSPDIIFPVFFAMLFFGVFLFFIFA